ncbi:hypothetical protein [Paenibacillus agaridevorans]|uniref:hypothetical protein n=1 Tax=Paenibacillus agaridevorans TaxID=171404 RepID=UPI001BE3E573|nr:hypothetical protein [Paenibacillus agaridevorans]
MINNDFIAYLKPTPNQFNHYEWRDVAGRITDIHAESHRIHIRASLSPGLYSCRLETIDGGFDMNSAKIPMVRVPDGELELVGPWDFDHITGVMAMPMARTYVNNRLVGGMWFDLPGPDGIEKNRLHAEFGFEAESEETELILEFVEKDRDRIDWQRIKYIEIRKDDRVMCELRPVEKGRPSIYLNADDVDRLREKYNGSPELDALKDRILNQTWEDVSFDLVCFAYLMTKDNGIGHIIREKVMSLCHMQTWSGKADPLVMGGENDRGIAQKMYMVALAWNWCKHLFDSEKQLVIKEKVGHYLKKLHDFTILQRAYMGCPTPDPHSLGTWNGTAIACMAFYEDLEEARKALPFFHGLFSESLRLFPQDGKNAWATLFPYHLVRYLAAAHTFGGQRPELSNSSFLDHLGKALLACFNVPNSQEMQRGLRTREHRFLTAYLCRFHRTEGIDSIYQTFVEQERKTAGDVDLGLFDFLFAPDQIEEPIPFPKKPFFAKDIGMVTFASNGNPTISGSVNAGLRAGQSVSFHIQPHNREFKPSLGEILLSVDGSPVLIDISTYGQDSSLLNTMCFDEGGCYTQGQYLNGKIGPEKSSYIRRCLIGERFFYVHAVITDELHPKHKVDNAERIIIGDLESGTIVFSDSFAGAGPLQFATHLHCSGSVSDLGDGVFRLTGGQANLIAGIKDGDKGLSDDEKGEIFVSVLDGMDGRLVRIEEPIWHPPYIYGLNGKAEEQDIKFGRYPHYKRWRLEYKSKVEQGAFLVALSSKPGEIAVQENGVLMRDGSRFYFGKNQPIEVFNCVMEAELVITDAPQRRMTVIGARSFRIGARVMTFNYPIDMELELDGDDLQGSVYASSRYSVATIEGFRVDEWIHNPLNPRSNNHFQAAFQSV